MVSEKNLAAARHLTTWLSDVYWMPPDHKVVAQLEELSFESALIDEQEAIQARSVLAAIDEEGIKDIAVDYTSLFCGFKPTDPFPYESIYRGERRLLMQEPCAQVSKVYAENGYVPEQGAGNEPADHLSHELRFLAFLLDKACESAERNDRTAQDAYLEMKDQFIDQHLRTWVPTFCGEVADRSDTAFFRFVSSITQNALSSLRQLQTA